MPPLISLPHGLTMQPMLNIALRAARQAGEHIVRASDRLDLIPVTEKGSNDYVTEVDRAAEDIIIRTLQKAYPDHGFLAEESGSSNPDADYIWIIDPLDGTTNFVRGIPHYAVSIACQHQGKIEHAVVYNPVTREEFTASRGRGAQLNGRRIRVTARTNLDGALLGTFELHGGGAAELEAAVKTATTRQTQTGAVAQSMLDSIQGVNDDEVAVRLMALQTSLQASYQTTSSLYQLSLLKFL